MIIAQEYWSRENMSLVLFDIITELKASFIPAKLRLNFVPANNSDNKVCAVEPEQ